MSEKLSADLCGITASYRRPRVSNDNPFSEALFRTCKYRSDWPTKGFATRADAQSWVQTFVGASGSTRKHKSAPLRSEAPHEIGGQLV